MTSSSRYTSLGPIGRAILPLYLGRPLPPVVAMACYFDDSKRSPISGIAGYLASTETWEDQFTPAWNAALGKAPHKITEFHQKDARHFRGEFKGWEKEERDDFTAELVSVISKVPNMAGLGTATIMTFIADPKSPTAKKDQKYFDQLGYGMSLAMCFSDALALALQVSGDEGEIQPVVDEKQGTYDRMQLSFEQAMDYLRKTEPEKCERIMRPVPGRSHKIAALQAADLLAYEMVKEVHNRKEGRPVSKALSGLVRGQLHIARCLTMEYSYPGAPAKITRDELYRSDRDIRSPGLWFYNR